MAARNGQVEAERLLLGTNQVDVNHMDDVSFFVTLASEECYD